MSRIKIELPSQFIGSVQIPIRITDINYGNHLGNDAIVSLVHEARVQWLKTLGLTELHFAGVSLIMAGLSVEYKAEVFYPDVLRFDIGVGEVSSSSWELFFQISNNTNKIVAIAQTNMVCFDYNTRKVAKIPPAFLEQIGRL